MSIRNSMLVAIVAVVVVAAGFSIRAQRRGDRGRNRIPETNELLQGVKRLRCVFQGKPVDQTVAIDQIDTDEGTAVVPGFRGGVGVNVKLVGSNLHFLDVAIDGGLTVVTVFPRETHDGRLQAVYSRAAYPDAAQYMGDCEATR